MTKGLLMAGGSGTRLLPITKSLNKHLLPVFDKPMIYYSLSTLMLCGIREIAIVTRPEDIPLFRKLLGDGSQFGISLNFLEQETPRGIPDVFLIAENFLGGEDSVLILGDNIFVGSGMGTSLRRNLAIRGASIFAFPVSNPREYGIVEINKNFEILSLEEKPSSPKSNLAIPGIYFFDEKAIGFTKEIEISERGELEIVELLRKYVEIHELRVEKFERGVGWMDAGTVNSLYEASELIRVLQFRQGMRFNVPEEVAYSNGWISASELIKSSEHHWNTDYGRYLRELAYKND